MERKREKGEKTKKKERERIQKHEKKAKIEFSWIYFGGTNIQVQLRMRMNKIDWKNFNLQKVACFLILKLDYHVDPPIFISNSFTSLNFLWSHPNYNNSSKEIERALGKRKLIMIKATCEHKHQILKSCQHIFKKQLFVTMVHDPVRWFINNNWNESNEL